MVQKQKMLYLLPHDTILLWPGFSVRLLVQYRWSLTWVHLKFASLIYNTACKQGEETVYSNEIQVKSYIMREIQVSFLQKSRNDCTCNSLKCIISETFWYYLENVN